MNKKVMIVIILLIITAIITTFLGIDSLNLPVKMRFINFVWNLKPGVTRDYLEKFIYNNSDTIFLRALSILSFSFSTNTNSVQEYSYELLYKKAESKSASFADALICQLKDPDYRVRCMSIVFLSYTKDPRRYDVISRALINENNYFVKRSAIQAFSMIYGDERVVRVLKEYGFSDQNPEVRREAFYSLHNVLYTVDADAAIDALIAALHVKDEKIVKMALYDIAALADRRNIKDVEFLLNHKNKDIRTLAEHVITELKKGKRYVVIDSKKQLAEPVITPQIIRHSQSGKVQISP